MDQVRPLRSIQVRIRSLLLIILLLEGGIRSEISDYLDNLYYAFLTVILLLFVIISKSVSKLTQNITTERKLSMLVLGKCKLWLVSVGKIPSVFVSGSLIKSAIYRSSMQVIVHTNRQYID